MLIGEVAVDEILMVVPDEVVSLDVSVTFVSKIVVLKVDGVDDKVVFDVVLEAIVVKLSSLLITGVVIVMLLIVDVVVTSVWVVIVVVVVVVVVVVITDENIKLSIGMFIKY